ncbi:MAG: signal peptidase I [Vicinamibacterales bacterium]
MAVGGILLSPFLLFCRFVTVSGTSMEGTLRSGDRILIVRTDLVPAGLASRWLVARGRIVIARDPARPRRAIIKRVVAVAGDRLQIRNGDVIINGSLASDPPSVRPDEEDWPTVRQDRDQIVIRSGHYFLLSDNRRAARDSRSYGAFSRDTIIGIVVGVFAQQATAAAVKGGR